MKKFKIYLLVIIFFITGLLLGKSLQSTTPVTEVLNDKAIAEQAEDISIMFIFDDQNILTADFAYQEDLNLLAATRLASEQNNLDFDSKDYGEMGSLITQIGNKINGNNKLHELIASSQNIPWLSSVIRIIKKFAVNRNIKTYRSSSHIKLLIIIDLFCFIIQKNSIFCDILRSRAY